MRPWGDGNWRLEGNIHPRLEWKTEHSLVIVQFPALTSQPVTRKVLSEGIRKRKNVRDGTKGALWRVMEIVSKRGLVSGFKVKVSWCQLAMIENWLEKRCHQARWFYSHVHVGSEWGCETAMLAEEWREREKVRVTKVTGLRRQLAATSGTLLQFGLAMGKMHFWLRPFQVWEKNNCCFPGWWKQSKMGLGGTAILLPTAWGFPGKWMGQLWACTSV